MVKFVHRTYLRGEAIRQELVCLETTSGHDDEHMEKSVAAAAVQRKCEKNKNRREGGEGAGEEGGNLTTTAIGK